MIDPAPVSAMPSISSVIASARARDRFIVLQPIELAGMEFPRSGGRGRPLRRWSASDA